MTYVSRDWQKHYETGQTREMPDRYIVGVEYDYAGDKWFVLHRADRKHHTIVVDATVFNDEWQVAA